MTAAAAPRPAGRARRVAKVALLIAVALIAFPVTLALVLARKGETR